MVEEKLWLFLLHTYVYTHWLIYIFYVVVFLLFVTLFPMLSAWYTG